MAKKADTNFGLNAAKPKRFTGASAFRGKGGKGRSGLRGRLKGGFTGAGGGS